MLNLNIIRLIGGLLSQIVPFRRLPLQKSAKNAEPGTAGNTIFSRLFSAAARRSGPKGGEGIETPRNFNFRLFGKKWHCTGEGRQKNRPASLQGRSGQDNRKGDEKHDGPGIAVGRIRLPGKVKYTGAEVQGLTLSESFEAAQAGREGE
jgi:hypothetical protein